MKKITIIAPFAFAYSTYIANALKNYENVDIAIIYLDEPAFVYKNTLHRLQNSLSKLFLKRNLKKVFVDKRILTEISKREKQDVIFMIRPDMLSNKMLSTLKENTQQMVAYYWDSTRRFPRMVDVAPFFDLVYTYDRKDVNEYQFSFLTNYCYHKTPLSTSPNYQFFNISTNDYRLPLLEKLAEYIAAKNWSKKILVYNKTEIDVTNVEWIDTQIGTKEVTLLIEDCSIIVEIQRGEQIGLSFRVFEALALEKKLITTNADIVTYDFYDANNILVLDADAIHIPESFVTSPYKKLEKSIVEYYQIDAWVQRVFDLE